MGSLSELGHVLSDVDSSDAGVAVDRHVVSKGDDDLLDLLGELSGGREDESLGRLDRGVDLGAGTTTEVNGMVSATVGRKRCPDEGRTPSGREKRRPRQEIRSWTDLLEDRDGEGGGLSGSRLGLGDDIVSLDDGDDGSLLDGGRSLESVRVDSSEELRLELHVVEAKEAQEHQQEKDVKMISDWLVAKGLGEEGEACLLVDNLVPVGLDDLALELKVSVTAANKETITQSASMFRRGPIFRSRRCAICVKAAMGGIPSPRKDEKAARSPPMGGPPSLLILLLSLPTQPSSSRPNQHRPGPCPAAEVSSDLA